MTKKKIIVFTLIGILLLSAVGCSGINEEESAQGNTQTEQNSKLQDEIVQEEMVKEEVNTEEVIENPVNKLVFTGGANFTGMVYETTENFPDGVYNYVNRTEDGKTRIVNRCISNNSSVNDVNEYLIAFVRSVGGMDVDDIIIHEIEDETWIKGNMPTYYAKWTCTEDGTEQKAVGIIATAENYTYCYYFATESSSFEEMEEVFNDILYQVDLNKIL